MFFQPSGLHFFTFRGVEVYLTLWYGILMGFVIFLWPAMGSMTMADGVLIALAITISLLVHEFGHAFMAKRYSLSPTIVLHAFGGFCAYAREAPSDGDDARVVFAGPLAGLVLAGLVFVFTLVAPGVVGAHPMITLFVSALLFINLVWSLINLLLPIYPLDGGQLFHLLMRRFMEEEKARRVALNVSIFTMIPVGLVAFLMWTSFLIAIFAVFVLMDNFMALQQDRPLVHRRSGRSSAKASSFHEELLQEAREALEKEDWREAARLAHHMRSVGSMPAKMLDQVWTILGVATVEMGEYEEAAKYLERAPKSGVVKKALQRCERGRTEG